MGSLQFPLTAFHFGSHIKSPVIGFQGLSFIKQQSALIIEGCYLDKLMSSPYQINLRETHQKASACML